MKKQEVIYGLHAVEKFIKQSPHLVFRLAVMKGRLNKRQQSLVDQAKALGLHAEFVAKNQFDSLQDVNHQGVMAWVQARPEMSESDLQALIERLDNPLFLFLDEVQDPHNLGAILRTADAAGVDAVVIPKHNSVGINATVRKVACGAAESVNLIVVSNLVRTMKSLQQSGMWMIGLAGETDQTIYEHNLTGSLGLVMGTEGSGLRRLTKEACDHLAAIPMVGQVESLNVSVATGITLYEAFRQRRL
ncbi:23S rRNA (guanosine(2251)-2'-O)-methyltransferase RlmB [Thiomicrorhabdus sp. zzn3]|uniref:23S rRNA (guanosine(2251)-2'-O)-methyltransferase RlmB n=1 Tax=Thiomicrorhabdus sp. zzn3 TaxID=3039775 RepID=UPI002436CBBB|nr:23S rRNA (guanosine(2251)-2'-O)-methyltransferase RlmB [Thiomicrorhabdus sp. zzn3]MDG6777578.1 23S rRNA (guanosine(2251)-2'-O)-methyltransferase RlmB [Thiomicrorhabdus sp. zzn3]